MAKEVELTEDDLKPQECVCGKTYPAHQFSNRVWADEEACPECLAHHEAEYKRVEEYYKDCSISDVLEDLIQRRFIEWVELEDENGSSIAACHFINYLQNRNNDKMRAERKRAWHDGRHPENVAKTLGEYLKTRKEE